MASSKTQPASFVSITTLHAPPPILLWASGATRIPERSPSYPRMRLVALTSRGSPMASGSVLSRYQILTSLTLAISFRFGATIGMKARSIGRL
ncbi:flavonol synthase/flavanone 3-hydroxylase-like [Iris pallida]|uniref:Flavonol synthase/flavanone 3-hydroxylase-like n=1 Tax=Iris pallida TaxID=29817 RepID=A0AAX6HA25_IRIPA|nr:flavonol synthase/flavanone 3-hydroxylase-like [Iris pallida]